MPENQRLTNVPGLTSGAISKGPKSKYMHQAKNTQIPDQGDFKNKMGGQRKSGSSSAKKGRRG